MESLSALIEAIPLLFSYFIPGYVYIWVRKQLNHTKKHDNMELLFICIVVTFILNLVISVIMGMVGAGYSMERRLGFGGAYTNGNLICICFAVVCGYLSSKVKYLKTVKRIKTFFKIDGTSFSTVWNAALTEPGWATVYLDELNICYVGRVQYIFTDPDIEKKEIYLTQYKAYDMKEEMKELVNHEASKKHGIYIDCKDVSRIEMLDDVERPGF